MRCPNCGYEDEGKYCSNCGSPLLHQPAESAPDKGEWYDRCPACRAGRLSKTVSRGFLGLTSTESYSCPNCGAVFTQEGSNRFKLSSISDTTRPAWRDYANHTLSDLERKRIAGGGVSDARQRELDLDHAITSIVEGRIQALNAAATGSIVPKRGERLVVTVPGVILSEPRSVRKTYGGGGGPSFRVAKGVYIRTGAFASRSESHEEIRSIDSGTLSLTNKRLVFAGQKRTKSINLGKIVSIKPFKDGISINREGKQKTEYYSGLDNAVLRFSIEGRDYEEPLSGAILARLIEGLLKTD